MNEQFKATAVTPTSVPNDTEPTVRGMAKIAGRNNRVQ